jgi:hypothetical protein
MFMSICAANCLIAAHGYNMWLLTPSHFLSPLATTCYSELAVLSDSELIEDCLQSALALKWKLWYNPRSVSQPVWFGVRHPNGAHVQTRGWACSLQLLLGLFSTIVLRPESSRTYNHIFLSHLRLPQLEGSGPHIYKSQEQNGPVISPGTGNSHAPPLKLKLYYDWWSFG